MKRREPFRREAPGRLLRRGYTLGAGVRRQSLDLDLSRMPAGVYFLAYRLRGAPGIYGRAKVVIAR